MRFEGHFLETVRQGVNILDLVGSYLQLRKGGRNHQALCPFHHEKSPSFMVSEAKQIFKCFGCGEGGDVFKFVMLIENLSFPEAVEFLAERYGIPLPRQDRSGRQESERRNRLLAAMETADRFFQSCLRSRRSDPDPLAYLQARRIDEKTVGEFGLGFAPPGNQLLSRLQKEGFSLEELETCGLLGRSAGGQFYDKFRNRVMFPIRDLNGRTIAFGGRILDQGMPKYLNSPDTPLYHKGKHLYGLGPAREAIRKHDFAILVEGYFDCIVPFQFGFRNAVASLGTALTESQVRLLGRYTRNVIVNFDPDSAGIAAAGRSIDLFLKEGFQVHVVSLPPGQDPDSFLRSEGRDAYLEKIRSSAPFLDFMLNHFMAQQKAPSSPRAKQEVVAQILPYLAKVPNRIERSEQLARIAARLHLDERLVRGEMRKMVRPGGKQESLPKISPASLTEAEKHLLAGVFDSQQADLIFPLLHQELLEGLTGWPIFEKILRLRKRREEISVLNVRDQLDDQRDVDALDEIALNPSGCPLSPDILKASIQALHEIQVGRLSRQIQEEIQKVEASGMDSGCLDELLRKKEKIRKQMEWNLV